MKRVINKLNKKKVLMILGVFVLGIVLSTKLITINTNVKPKSSSNVFLSKDYTYLPKKAYNYVIKYYEETGIILKTEKNKKSGEAYLNPAFVAYLENGGASSYVPSLTTIDYSYKTLGNSEFASKYDSRNVNGKNYVTSLKDQGSYPLCWDFALTSVLESKLIKEGLTTSSIDLSERQIDYASSDEEEAVDIGKNPYVYNSYSLTSGGNSTRYFSAVANGISPVLEDSFDTYTTTGKKSPEKVWNIDNVNYSVNGYYQLPNDNDYNYSDALSSKNFINTVKQAIIDNGSVGMAVSVGSSGTYVSYNNNNDDMISDKSIKLYYKDPQKSSLLDHDVAIIGWNDDYTLDVCISDDGNMSISSNCSGTKKTIHGAWLAKNSYGLYNYVAYDTYGSEFYIINSVSNKNYDNIYTTNMGDYDFDSKNEYKEVTMRYKKLSNTEKVEKVKFSTLDLDKDYSVYINGDEVGSVKTTYSGIYTLDLSNKNIILDNTSFDVSVRSSNGDYYPQNISVFTSNKNSDITMSFQDIDNFDALELTGYSEKHLILTNGISRNLKQANELVYKVLDSEQNDVTSNFTFYRKYAVSNYIYTIIGFNDINSDTYNVSVYYNNKEYANFEMYIDLEYISVRKVILDKNELSLNAGESDVLQATVKPNNATNKSVNWVSSDPNVASVDENGKVTAHNEGFATITVSAKENSNKQDECFVQVTNNNTSEDILVNKIVLSESDFEILNGATKTITAEVFPSNATNKNISWSSSNPDVAKISSDGTITALSKGETTITAKAQDNSKVQSSIKVTVFDNTNNTCNISLEDRKIGDIDCDGKVSDKDRTLLFRHAFNLYLKETNNTKIKILESAIITDNNTLSIANTNGDTIKNNVVNQSDYIRLGYFIAGKIPKICNSNNKCYSK